VNTCLWWRGSFDIDPWSVDRWLMESLLLLSSSDAARGAAATWLGGVQCGPARRGDGRGSRAQRFAGATGVADGVARMAYGRGRRPWLLFGVGVAAAVAVVTRVRAPQSARRVRLVGRAVARHCQRCHCQRRRASAAVAAAAVAAAAPVWCSPAPA